MGFTTGKPVVTQIDGYTEEETYSKVEADNRYVQVLQRVFKSDNARRLITGTANIWRITYNQLDLSITPIRTDSILRVKINLNFHGSTGAIFVRVKRNGVVDPELNGSGGDYNCFAHCRVDDTSSLGQYNTACGILDIPITHDGTTQTFTLEHRVQVDGRFTVNRDGSTSSDSTQGTHSPTMISTFEVEELTH